MLTLRRGGADFGFDANIAIQMCQLFEIAATVCKNHWIWKILQKIEDKWV